MIRIAVSGGIACMALFGLTSVAASQDGDFVPPVGNVAPNYDRVSIGQREGLEGNAFVARTDDAGANWYNPAGLVLSEKTALNASANAYEVTTTSLEGLEAKQRGTRFSSVGTFFGGVIGAPIIESPKWRLGFSFTKPTSWSPSQVEGAFELDTTAGHESFLYSTTVSFTTVVPALNAGFRLGEQIRLGAGVGYAITTLYQNQLLSDRLLSETTADFLTRNLETDGSTGNVLLTGAVQVTLGSHARLGGVITAPGIRMSGSSRITYHNTRLSGPVTQEITFRDSEAKFDYQLPLRVAVGAALQLGRGEVELDLRYHGSRDGYALFSSTVPATLVTTDAAGVPTVTAPSFPAIMEKTRAVGNVAIGGNYPLSSTFRIHAGFFTDESPVGDSATSIFRQLDLVGASAGVSFAEIGGSRLSGSVGVSSSWGTSAGRQIGPSLGGVAGVTRVEVRTFNLLYAISYAF